MRRLLYFAALSMLALLILAPTAQAEGVTDSQGEPSGPYGKYTCADFADQLQAQEAYLEGGQPSVAFWTLTATA